MKKPKKRRKKPMPAAKRAAHFRLGTEFDIAGVQALWCADGEGNVHGRADDFIKQAVGARNLYVIESEGAIIGTGAEYPYCNGRYGELGSSCLAKGFRSFGLVDIMLNLRIVLGCLNLPGIALGAELYPGSVKSAAVLSRWGFKHAPMVTVDMLAHSEADAPGVPLAHYVLPPSAVPAHARSLLRFMEGGSLAGGDIGFEPRFNANLRLDDAGVRSAVEMLADGELGVAGYAGHERSSASEWLASRSPFPLVMRQPQPDPRPVELIAEPAG